MVEDLSLVRGLLHEELDPLLELHVAPDLLHLGRALDEDIGNGAHALELLPAADITLLPLERSVSHTGVTCKYDTRLTEDELGFRSEWTMRQGIKDTVNTVRREQGLPEV